MGLERQGWKVGQQLDVSAWAPVTAILDLMFVSVFKIN